MNTISVLDVFYTSIGEIVILIFPDKQYPEIGMILKRQDGAKLKIAGIGMPKPSEMTNGYKHLSPPRLVFDCKIEKYEPAFKLIAGDTLEKYTPPALV